MTKGELISACIKLMFDNNEQIDTSIVSDDETYQDRTNNIIESINRAIIRLNQLNKLPFGFKSIDSSKNGENVITIALDDDYIELINIYKYKLNSFDLNPVTNVLYLPFNTVCLPNLNENYVYYLYYKKAPLKLSYSDSDEMEIPLPDYITSIIPYFVKGDLYEEDNANMALLARNMFESYANDLPNPIDALNSKNIIDIFDDWWR